MKVPVLSWLERQIGTPVGGNVVPMTDDSTESVRDRSVLDEGAGLYAGCSVERLGGRVSGLSIRSLRRRMSRGAGILAHLAPARSPGRTRHGSDATPETAFQGALGGETNDDDAGVVRTETNDDDAGLLFDPLTRGDTDALVVSGSLRGDRKAEDRGGRAISDEGYAAALQKTAGTTSDFRPGR